MSRSQRARGRIAHTAGDLILASGLDEANRSDHRARLRIK
jgi:hypothetical protein